MPQIVNTPTYLVPPTRPGGAGNPPRLYLHVESIPGPRPQIREQVFTLVGGPSIASPSWGMVLFVIQTNFGPYHLSPLQVVGSRESVACPTKPFTIPRVLVYPRGGVTMSTEFEWKND